MNTYCVVKLPEEAKGLVPSEILQVSIWDWEHITQLGPERQDSLRGCLVSPLQKLPSSSLVSRKIQPLE